MAYTRECTVCHKKYEYCYCDQFRDKPRWMIMYCSDNCRKIFDTLQRHFTKEITDEEAIKRLDECDLSVMENATETAKKDLAEILAKRKTKEETTQETTQEKQEVPVAKSRTDKKVQYKPKAKANDDVN